MCVWLTESVCKRVNIKLFGLVADSFLHLSEMYYLMIYAATHHVQNRQEISASEIFFCRAHSRPTTWDETFSTYLWSSALTAVKTVFWGKYHIFQIILRVRGWFFFSHWPPLIGISGRSKLCYMEYLFAENLYIHWQKFVWYLMMCERSSTDRRNSSQDCMLCLCFSTCNQEITGLWRFGSSYTLSLVNGFFLCSVGERAF